MRAPDRRAVARRHGRRRAISGLYPGPRRFPVRACGNVVSRPIADIVSLSTGCLGAVHKKIGCRCSPLRLKLSFSNAEVRLEMRGKAHPIRVNQELGRLTEEERDLLQLLVQGHTAKTIAATRGMSVNAVNERLRSARKKTGAPSSRELARLLASADIRHHPKSCNKEIGVTGKHIRGQKRQDRGLAIKLAPQLLWRGLSMFGVVTFAAALAVYTNVPEAVSTRADGPEPSLWTVAYIKPSEHRFVAVDWRSIERVEGHTTFRLAKVRRDIQGEVQYDVSDERLNCASQAVSGPPENEDQAVIRVVCHKDLTFSTVVFSPEVNLQSLAAGLLAEP